METDPLQIVNSLPLANAGICSPLFMIYADESRLVINLSASLNLFLEKVLCNIEMITDLHCPFVTSASLFDSINRRKLASHC